MFHVKHSPVPLSRFTPNRVSPGLRDGQGNLWDGDHANGETHELVAIAKTGTGYSGDTGLLKEGEGIFTGPQLAPVIDRGVIVDENVFEQVLFFIKKLELSNETLPAQLIEGPQLFHKPWASAYQAHIRHIT